MTKKKIFITALVITVFVFALGIVANAGTYEDLTYEITSKGVRITDCDESATSVIIPETIEGYPVTSIGAYAFSGCEDLISVIIPDGVTSIVHYAFYDCRSLEHIIIPESVTLIDGYAFCNCKSLQSITIPGGVTAIEPGTFKNCTDLDSIIIPESVTLIGDGAFEGCEKVKIHGVKGSTVETYANAKSIPFVEIKSEIASGTIKNTDITWVVDANGTLILSGTGDVPDYTNTVRPPWFAYRTQILSVVVQDGITSIGDYVFGYLRSATSITLPESVTYVGQLFMRNTDVCEIKLPGVETIENGAFNGAESLETVILSEKLSDCRGNVFANTQTVTIKAPSKSFAFYYGRYFTTLYPEKAAITSVSDGTTAKRPILAFGKMGDNAIYAIYQETDRNVMEVSGEGTTYNYWFISEKRIEMDKQQGGNNFAPIYYLYENPTKQPIVRAIKKIVVREGITSIGNYSFYRCLKATEVEILGPVTWIGNAAFQACEGIRSITLPESCTKFGDFVFNGCKYLGSVTVSGDVTRVGIEIFKNCLVDRTEDKRPESANLLVYTNSEFLKDYVSEVYPNENFRVVVKKP